ncbi:MAG: phytanoyl-CoA dioxygenase family protein, partial [Betaproteobacteria bacterium]
MTPEQVLAIKPKVLTQAQRESYFNDGFVLVERAI